jgi:hypothetical protein
MAKQVKIDAVTLRRMYVKERMPDREIGLVFGVTEMR